MLAITDKHRVFLAINPIDFRTRLNGSLAICRQQLELDPSTGHIFVFRNKKTTTIRCIIYDHGGFWFMEKRLSKGRFKYWPASRYECCEMTATQLNMLLSNDAGFT